MKRAITLTTTWIRENDFSFSTGLQEFLKRILSGLKGLAFTLLGFSMLVAFWHVISLITKGELPTPLATSLVFWDLVKEPFYDLGPNDKGIGLQLFSSLGRVFGGFLLGSLVAIPIGLLMGANSFCKKVFYPIV